MAKIEFLLQNLQGIDDHEVAVNRLLSTVDAEAFLLSIAFVRNSGVERLQDALGEVSEKTQVFVGIRNGVTSVQAIKSLLDLGIHPYLVDTASYNIVFHPKLYMAYNSTEAHIIVGSANLTYGGLVRNIEFGSYISLDRSRQQDEKILRYLKDTVTAMPSCYPDHAFRVRTVREVVQLLREGRLEDERVHRLPSAAKARAKSKDVKLAPIPLPHAASSSSRRFSPKNYRPSTKGSATLVWISNPLTERSLNIPTGENTHPTGGMSLGKGQMEGMDFQKYFRNEVFSGLSWRTHSESLERATASFEIVIAGVSHGYYDLQIKHNPREDTKTYRQGNYMTSIKWGSAKELIADENLLRRTLSLYRIDPKNFLINID